jgi:membrane protein implicated in regulation of membrane protease activity
VTSRNKKDPRLTQNLQPTRRDRFLPVELLGISAALAVFVGLIVLMATREFVLAGVGFGITFIISLVLLALFALAFKPTEAEVEDIHEQDAEARAKAAETRGTAEGDDRPRGH